jgi:hypothetical protein
MGDTMAKDDLDKVLDEVDPGKRAFLKQLIVSTAFTVPTVSSFSVRDLSLAEAQSGPPATT